jgi:hypothetical protein
VEVNPFERIVVKRKREVLGQQIKPQEVKAGQARNRAQKQVWYMRENNNNTTTTNNNTTTTKTRTT